MSTDSKDLNRQRIDKWLWHARMVRTRTDAAALTAAGFVRLNGKRLTAAGHPVRVGDVVTLALDRSVRVVRVEGLCERRGAAPAARTLYRDLTTSSGTGACTPSANHLKVFAVSAAAGPALAVASRRLRPICRYVRQRSREAVRSGE